jgi:hypothetical protein
MANALATDTMPPAPDMPGPPPTNAGGPSPRPQPQNGLVQQPQPPPAPTHQQTVAALRHFDAVRSTWEKIAKNPEFGKSDLKKAIIDGASKLVADRIVKPDQAVTMLSVVPSNPFQQKKWVAEQIMHNQTAETMVLDHHRSAFYGTPDQDGQQASTMDTHHDDLAGLMGHYKNG